MQGLIIGLFITTSIFLTGCGSNQPKTKVSLQDSPAPQQVAIQTPETIPAAETPAVEIIVEEQITPEVKPIATPKKINTTPKQDLAIATPPAPNIVDPIPTPPGPTTIPSPAPAPVPPPAKEISHWQPNEVHLIRGTELINGLQRDIGRKPNIAEMQQRLQSHMGLSALQAKQLISSLGLE